jgi:hypothetical protein
MRSVRAIRSRDKLTAFPDVTGERLDSPCVRSSDCDAGQRKHARCAVNRVARLVTEVPQRKSPGPLWTGAWTRRPTRRYWPAVSSARRTWASGEDGVSLCFSTTDR